MLIHARHALLQAQIGIAKALRGCGSRSFGLALPAGPGNGGASAFDPRLRGRLANRPDLALIAMPMLEACQAVRTRVTQHDRAHASASLVRHDRHARADLATRGQALALLSPW